MNRTILIVEDSTEIRTLIAFTLQRDGWHVVEASNGLEALRLARRHRPALVVMDINLPGMDGLEVTRQIRSDPALEDVPVLALTAYAFAATTTLARQAGCQHVMFKPFELLDFVSAVRGLSDTRLGMPLNVGLPFALSMA